MKVYVALRQFDYEGDTPIGVSVSEEGAKAICANDTYRCGFTGTKNKPRGDSYVVESFELDGGAQDHRLAA